MAVNIDTVYQRVLAIANKEQRGYITPQEFNLLANQAQMNIFEQYFYDWNQFEKGETGNDSTYSDMLDLLNEKIDIFEKFRVSCLYTTNVNQEGIWELPDHYRMGELYSLCNGQYVEIEKIDQNQLHHIQNSPLTAPTLDRPIYVRTSNILRIGSATDLLTGIPLERTIQVFPTITTGVVCNYIDHPSKVSWGYTIVNEQALYNANRTTHFELHPSEEKNLVIKILELAGILIKDPNLYQLAGTEEAQYLQQEKQ